MKEMEYENIKEKLKKLLALAERGDGGEAENARRLLEELSNKYGVSIEDLLDENQVEYHFFEIGRNKIYLDLFSQCYYKVTGTDSLSYKQISRSQIAVKMTAMQYAEMVSLFAWHKANFDNDLEEMKKNILLAYCRKHRLYCDVKNDKEYELTSDEKIRLFKIIHMEASLNNRQYQKLLE